MTPLDRLRLAAALTHSIAGAQLRVDADTGESLIVGAHPAADLDPCKLRRIVSSAAASRLSDQLGRLTAIEFAGSLTERAGGVFEIADTDRVRRAVATFVTADGVLELIARLDDVADSAVEATLRPDGGVGVTVIEFAAPPEAEAELDAIAERVASMCFVAEVLRDARRVADAANGSSVGEHEPVLRHARPRSEP